MGTLGANLRLSAQAKGLRYIDFRGNPNSRVWLVGEAPGADEDAQGFPFVGPSGQEQDRMLREAGWDINEICFTNVYRVRPPDNDLDRIEELGIPKTEFENGFLEELCIFRPTIIVCAGATSLGFLCPDCRGYRGAISITKWRGSILTSPRLNWHHYVVGVSHPAFVLREWSERVISVFCYARAYEEYSHWLNHDALQPLPQRELLCQASADDVIAYLYECLASPDPISIDIEMLRRRFVYTIALAVSPARAMSFALWEYDNDKTAQIFRLLDKILRTKRQIGQNYLSFDIPWLETIGFAPNVGLVDDTLPRHHVLWPELPHKLEFQTMQYTRSQYYKDEGRNIKVKNASDRTRLKRYNAMDAAVTYEIFLAQEDEFNGT